MTEDELDLLASAYVDGEATPEEVALVERDPDLLARVEAMRAVGGRLGAVPEPPPALKEQHLAAALSAFDTAFDAAFDTAFDAGFDGEVAATADATADADPGDGNVVRFGDRRRADRVTEPRRSLPTWLPAAAVFVLIAGGLIAFLGSQSDDLDVALSGSSDESAEETEAAGDADAMEDAGTEVAAESAEGEQARNTGGADDTADSAEAMTVVPEDDAAMEDDAMEEEAMEDEADGDDEEAAEDSDQAVDVTGSREPVFEITGPPGPLDLTQMLNDLPALFDPAEATCADRVDLEALGFDADAVQAGWVPVTVQGLPAELHLVIDGDGTETGRLFDADTCDPIE